MRLKKAALNIVLLLLSLVIGAACLEAALRLTDSTWERYRKMVAHPAQDALYQHTKSGLYVLAPSQTLTGRGSCFEAFPVTINPLGMRGAAAGRKKAAIALLGDSFMEALQVPDGRSLADLLLKEMGGAEVLNAGVSGYATTHALQSFKERVADFHPTITVLALYLGNDISGNSCALSRTGRPCGEIENGRVRYLHPPTSGAAGHEAADANRAQADGKQGRGKNSPLRDKLRNSLALYALAHDLKMVVMGLASEALGRVDPRWGIYRLNTPSAWEDAWVITADLLGQLKAETMANGSRLVVMIIPEMIAVMPSPENAIRFGSGSAVPDDLDLVEPSRRAANLAAQLGIPALDLLAVFSAYKDRHSLPPPYFSYACDGHWNPMGHLLAAAALTDFLKRLESGQAAATGVDQVMSMDPRRLLGEEAYRQIYQGGVYRPKAAVE